MHKSELVAVFPGRFQPMTLGHVMTVRMLVSTYRDVGKLVIVQPSNLCLCRENPFQDADAMEIARLSLEEAALGNVEVCQSNVSQGLIRAWNSCLKEHHVDVVFTGNKKMEFAVRAASFLTARQVQIRRFADGVCSSIRATEVRNKIRDNDQSWRELVMPKAAEYIESHMPKWSELLIGRKHNWNF